MSCRPTRTRALALAFTLAAALSAVVPASVEARSVRPWADGAVAATIDARVAERGFVASFWSFVTSLFGGSKAVIGNEGNDGNP